MKESGLLKQFLVEYCKFGNRMWRINSGKAWVGKVVRRTGNTITLENPRVFHGAIKGTPDLYGFTQKKITQDMVGKVVAVFTAIEVKTENVVVTKEQKSFIKLIQYSGGISGVCRSLKDVLLLHSTWKGVDDDTKRDLHQSKESKERLI